MKSRANQITTNVIRMASTQGCTVWRNNTLGVFDGKIALDKIWRLVQSGRVTTAELKKALQSSYRTTNERKGASDVLGFYRKTGQFLAIEIKGKGDKLSIEQQQFLKEVAAAGLAFVVAEEPEKMRFTVLGCEKITACNEVEFLNVLREKLKL